MRAFSIVLLLVISVVLSVRLAFFIGETVFFDKLIFAKSVTFGYFPAGGNTNLKAFGDRSKDVVKLLSAVSEDGHISQTPAKDLAASPEFVIAIIGDSYVWGQGIKNEQRFPVLLEKELNTYRKTKVLSLAQIGDSALDNYLKYKILNKTQHVDLYIFALVENDVMYNVVPRYLKQETTDIMDQCQSMSAAKLTLYDFKNELHDPNYYERSVEASFQNPANMCVLNYVASQYPKNALYFSTTDYDGNDLRYQAYTTVLQKNGLHLISSSQGKNLPQYQSFWHQGFWDVWKAFTISAKEKHSSPLANQLFTDVLKQELLNDPSLGFVRK